MPDPLRRSSRMSAVIGRAILCFSLSSTLLYSADLSQYRGLRFGMRAPDAGKGAGANTSNASVLHRRPALIQEMEWEPNHSLRYNPANTDPVKQALLYFVNGELYRIIVMYDRYQIEGMTVEDMVEGISAAYGPPHRPTADIAFHSNYGEVAKVLARWEDEEYAYDLVRTGDQSSFALVLYSKRLDALAQKAITEAARLDLQEAPQRELDKQKNEADAARILSERARSLNKPNFRP